MENEVKKEKFSYSKLDTFEGCGFKYKLQYIDKHHVSSDSIAADFGTLVHYIEETIANDIVANDNEPHFMIDDNKYLTLFMEADIHKFENPKNPEQETETVLGLRKLRDKYPKEFYEKDKSGMDYEEKANHYINNGIYWLRDYLARNRNIRVVATEKEFNLEYGDYIFHGFVDRILQDITTGEYFIQDIKTWPTIEGHDVITPLQFVFYSLAVSELYNTPLQNISCSYYLPFQMNCYDAGTVGFIKRGTKKIDKLLEKIKEGNDNFAPKPTPLCHWCVYSKTYPNQPEEAKNLCPYFCHWTKTNNKDFSVEYDWMGIENHDAIVEAFKHKCEVKDFKETLKNIAENMSTKVNFDIVSSDRIVLVRR